MKTLYDNIAALIADKGETSLKGNKIKVKFKVSANTDFLGSRNSDTVTVNLTYKFNPDKHEYTISKSTSTTNVEMNTGIRHNNDGLFSTDTLTEISQAQQLYTQAAELENLRRQIENYLSEAGWTRKRGFFSSLFG